MKVTRDVVLDLLPLYVAGEASADTRALVEDYLRQDPTLRVDQGALGALSQGVGTAAPLPPDRELRSLRRTRGLLRWQRLAYAWALALSLLSLTSVFSLQEGRLRFQLLLLDHPQIFVPCVLLALSCWVNYYLLRRRLRVTKLQ